VIGNDILINLLQVRDELEQLLDDDDDMADLYLSRKLAGASSPVSVSGGANWFPASPTIGSKISRASRASVATIRGDENDVEELEMLLVVGFLTCFTFHFRCLFLILIGTKGLFLKMDEFLQAYFMQIDSSLNKLTTVCAFYLLFLFLPQKAHTLWPELQSYFHPFKLHFEICSCESTLMTQRITLIFR
jgi:hypothetical protein